MQTRIQCQFCCCPAEVLAWDDRAIDEECPMRMCLSHFHELADGKSYPVSGVGKIIKHQYISCAAVCEARAAGAGEK